MIRLLTALMIVAGLMFAAAPAMADWDQTQGWKMHFPQMPNPNGWDVNFMDPKIVADDWECIETGYVEDIHFWMSSYHDMPFEIENIHVSIHKDIPAGTDQIPYSRPGSLEWERDFGPNQFTVRDWDVGNQGWFDPNFGEMEPDNHQQIFQVNIAGIDDPYVQEQGNIYWLDLSLKGDLVQQPMLGWKTSNEHFMDWPVFRDDFAGGTTEWQLLTANTPFPPDILGGDMAFVINGNPVPEPGTLVLTAAGLLGLAGFAAWRRRKKA